MPGAKYTVTELQKNLKQTPKMDEFFRIHSQHMNLPC